MQTPNNDRYHIVQRITIIYSKIKITDAVIGNRNKRLKACLLKIVVSLFKEEQEKVEFG